MAAARKMGETVKLTDDQRKQMGPIGQEGGKLMQEVMPKVNASLTDEQKAKLREAMPGRGGRRNRGGDAPAPTPKSSSRST